MDWRLTSGFASGNDTWIRFEKCLFGGCHFTRPIVDLVATAGFSINEVDLFYEQCVHSFLDVGTGIGMLVIAAARCGQTRPSSASTVGSVTRGGCHQRPRGRPQ